MMMGCGGQRGFTCLAAVRLGAMRQQGSIAAAELAGGEAVGATREEGGVCLSMCVCVGGGSKP